MEPFAILHTDPLDLLFESRNKMYGAYTLRKFYVQRMYISIAATLTAVVMISLMILFGSAGAHVNIVQPIPDVVICSLLAPTTEPPQPKPNMIPAKRSAVIAFTAPLIVPNQKLIEPIATVDKLDIAAIGPMTTAGDPTDGTQKGNGLSGNGASVPEPTRLRSLEKCLNSRKSCPNFPVGSKHLKDFCSAI